MTGSTTRADRAANRALVLGGGGLAGTAWQVGVLTGLADAGIDPRGVDTVIGTSAGATTAAQLTSGRDVEQLYQAQRDAADDARESAATVDPLLSADDLAVWKTGSLRAAVRRRVGERALRARTVPQSQRRELIASRLPTLDWPASTRLVLTAVDAESGAFVAFDGDAGVPLVDAVAASCAVPTLWPPVTIDGRRYIDGGVRSLTNADLAEGHARVLVLSPIPADADTPFPHLLTAELRRFEPGDVRRVEPDRESLAAFGPDWLRPVRPDPAVRRPAAAAGRAQGRTLADELRRWW